MEQFTTTTTTTTTLKHHQGGVFRDTWRWKVWKGYMEVEGLEGIHGAIHYFTTVVVLEVQWLYDLRSEAHLLALRPVGLIRRPLLRLLVVGPAQQPDPLLTLLLSDGELVDVALHVPGPEEVRLHGRGLFAFPV